MFNVLKPLGISSVVVIGITFVLFLLALFTKGLTHDILLEAGLFLVSVKLIIMAYKNAEATNQLTQRLDRILEEVELTKDSCSR
ncbi:MAG TPA: hypothetical protein VKN82_10480 [Desulfohalobiaceae bacterium]|nr:hypothetical protein [Desulfohalobiaceae bacterium]